MVTSELSLNDGKGQTVEKSRQILSCRGNSKCKDLGVSLLEGKACTLGFTLPKEQNVWFGEVTFKTKEFCF